MLMGVVGLELWFHAHILYFLNSLAEILLLSIVSYIRVGPLNQWGFGKSTSQVPLIQMDLL